MNRSAKRGIHEKARKQHKHELEEHAREAAKRPRSAVPIWLLVVGITLMLGLVILPLVL